MCFLHDEACQDMLQRKKMCTHIVHHVLSMHQDREKKNPKCSGDNFILAWDNMSSKKAATSKVLLQG